MKIMGLSSWVHWIAWFTKCFIFLLIPMIIITFLSSFQFIKETNGRMIDRTHWSVIFVYLIIYSISAIMFCFMVSTFFYRANLAAAAGGIMWFLAYVPYFFIANYYDRFTLKQKIMSCLDFQVAMSMGANLIGRFEGQGSGIQWSNIFEGVTVDDDFTFAYVLGMMLFDSFMYGFITWYVETVYPGEFGIPRPWYFLFQRSYWHGYEDEVIMEFSLSFP